MKYLIIGLILCTGCVYYYIDTEGCAYCEERTLHFITQPMCEGDAEDKRRWIDSIQVQGSRNGQLWHCEIR